MKKLFAVLMMAALLLAGCAAQKDGLQVDAGARTISDGTNTYSYTDITEGAVRTVTVTYPDGNSYVWVQETGGRYTGLYNREKYVDGASLVAAVIDPDPADEDTYVKVVGGVTYTVDIEGQTVSANGYTFPYEFNMDQVKVTYPDGSVLNAGPQSISWAGGQQETMMQNGAPYADCYDLVSVLPEPQSEQPKMQYLVPGLLAGILLIAFGIWQFTHPEITWKWRIGRWVKESEPTEEALGMFSACGLIIIIIGIGAIVFGFLA